MLCVLKKGELLAKEQIFGDECRAANEEQSEEGDQSRFYRGGKC